MLVPVVTWYNEDNTAEKEGHDFGKIDIGSSSEEVVIIVWNNRGGTEEASTMENCVLTTKDLNGGNDLEAVAEQYVQVRNITLGEEDFTPIGGVWNTPLGPVEKLEKEKSSAPLMTEHWRTPKETS